MTSEEALNFLDQTVSQINGSRQFHVQLQQAIECLRILVAENEVKLLRKENE